MKISIITFCILLISAITGLSQFAPPVGYPGSTAISADSSIFIGWGTDVVIDRGPVSVDNLSLGNADYGSVSDALGIADNMVISLGDGGSAIYYFSNPIVNIDGPDFAVFENSFTDDFLELCFVEVSSDGINYFRFNAISLTQTDNQVATFGTIEATNLYNLGGKYRGMYGTPFDLEEFVGTSGLDLNNITNIKLIDVIGSIDSLYATSDSHGNFVNDPWPTEFPSSGFDLDAIGIINPELAENIILEVNNLTEIFPNPTNEILNIKFNINLKGRIKIDICDFSGKEVYSEIYDSNSSAQLKIINVSMLVSGIYTIRLSGNLIDYRQLIVII